MDWRDWGLWKSFETTEDKIVATLCALLILWTLRIWWHALRPQCCECGRIDWRWNVEWRVVSGHGPDTCESGAFCGRCR